MTYTIRRIMIGTAALAVSMPVAAQPERASAAMVGPGAPFASAEDDRDRATRCLTLAIAYEAGSETPQGRQAVGEVILNRVGNPDYPKSVCGVVFQGSARRTGCQFTFTCDGAMRRRLPTAVITSAHEVAERLIAGDFQPNVPGATHYHASYVSPYWAPTLVRLTRIGAHIFYRTPAGSGVATRYAPMPEPSVAQLGNILFAIDPNTQGVRGVRPGHATSDPSPVSVTSSAAPQVFSPWGLASALSRPSAIRPAP